MTPAPNSGDQCFRPPIPTSQPNRWLLGSESLVIIFRHFCRYRQHLQIITWKKKLTFEDQRIRIFLVWDLWVLCLARDRLVPFPRSVWTASSPPFLSAASAVARMSVGRRAMAETPNTGTYLLISLRAAYLYADENQVNSAPIANLSCSPSARSAKQKHTKAVTVRRPNWHSRRDQYSYSFPDEHNARVNEQPCLGSLPPYNIVGAQPTSPSFMHSQ